MNLKFPLILLAKLLGFVSILTLSCGCQSFKPSEEWKVVTQARIPGFGDESQNTVYAGKLHRVLTNAGVENKLVCFRYLTHYRQPRVLQRDAVIYRSKADAANPWWLADNMHSAPVWLPNGALDEQLRFAERTSWVGVISVETNHVSAAHAPVSTSHVRAETGQKSWEQMFRRVHGSTYDAKSMLDRMKMAELKKKLRS